MKSFKESPYWDMFAETVQFMRENYPVPNEQGYPDKVIQRYEQFTEKYRGTPHERFFCDLMSVVVYELQRLYFEGDVRENGG